MTTKELLDALRARHVGVGQGPEAAELERMALLAGKQAIVYAQDDTQDPPPAATQDPPASQTTDPPSAQTPDPPPGPGPTALGRATTRVVPVSPS